MSVLAVGAHPDDPEIGVGGILLNHAAQGHSVAVLTLTGGEQGGVQSLARGGVQARGRAARGAPVPQGTGRHQPHRRRRRRSRRSRRSSTRRPRPRSTLTRRATSTRTTATPTTRRSSPPAACPRVYCYQAPSTTVEFRPTRFVGIDDVLERKLEVIRAYASQVEVRHYLDEELLRATARYWSRWSRSRFAGAARGDPRERHGERQWLTRKRVLITGMGGPAGISVLRGIADDPLDVYSADIDPFAAGLYLVPPERRVMLPRGDSPRFVQAVMEVCRRHAIDVLVPDGRLRAAAGGRGAGGVRGRGRGAGEPIGGHVADVP